MDNKVKTGIVGALLGIAAGIGVAYKKSGKDFLKLATYGAIGGMACGGIGVGAVLAIDKIKFDKDNFSIEKVVDEPKK
jgi:hypothetical protein